MFSIKAIKILPTVKIFGGDGIGGAGRAILGGIVSNTPLDDLSRNVTRTASIIGVELTYPGSKYFYKEPLVSFSDSCGLGYGAVAKAIIDFPTGQIKNIVMLSEGENYPVGAGTDDDDESPLDPNIPVGIIDIEIPVPGDSYEPDDTRIIIDPTIEPPPPFNPEDPELGTLIEPDFDIVIEDGRIISVKPINIIQVNVLPKLRVVSGSGSGALLKPIIGRLPESKPGQKLIQVIDCVT